MSWSWRAWPCSSRSTTTTGLRSPTTLPGESADRGGGRGPVHPVGGWLPTARKYLPAARDYMAASLWRRAGLRINESRILALRDWRPDLGEHGKFHVRFGK